MGSRIIFITGTDTGVGKTVLTALFARYLRDRGLGVAALKPICSGGRDDARALQAALDGALTLEEINPWHFRAPLAPLLAARRERKRVKLDDVVAHVRKIQSTVEVVLVEGAGGLLSPLGEDFNARDLIVALRPGPVIVCPNRLGAVNQALLTVEAFPGPLKRSVQLVLMSPPRSDLASRTNPGLLKELLGAKRVHLLPWLAANCSPKRLLASAALRRTFDALLGAAMAG